MIEGILLTGAVIASMLLGGVVIAVVAFLIIKVIDGIEKICE